MAKHPDVLCDACCGNSAVTAIDSSEVDAFAKTKNASSLLIKPPLLFPDHQGERLVCFKKKFNLTGLVTLGDFKI
jgi:hypothetical protein